MADYKLVDAEQLDAGLKTVADAIREKGGTTEDLAFPDGMESAVRAIQSGGSAVDESVWIEDDSEIVVERTCYQNASVSAFITKNGTLTYKRIKDDSYEQGPKWSHSNDNQVNSTFGADKKYWYNIKQAEIVNDEKYASSPLITTIGNGAFTGLLNLKRLRIPDDITRVENYVFGYCESLKTVKLPSAVTYIGVGCFNYSNIEEFDIPPNVTQLEKNVFTGCRHLRKVNGIERLVSIGANCFDGCISLTGEIVFNEAIDSIENYLCRNSLLDIVKFRGTPTSVSSNAFQGCSTITDIYVPWAEGVVANAPWGATKATIHYNITYDADGNPIV